MDLDACGVQRDGFDPDTHDLRTLQLLEHAIQDASFGPAIHARVNRVPVAEAFGQSAPLATMFGHIKDRIDHLQIAQADVATLPGQAVFNGSELFGRDLHVGDFLAQSSPSPLVLTRPRETPERIAGGGGLRADRIINRPSGQFMNLRRAVACAFPPSIPRGDYPCN